VNFFFSPSLSRPRLALITGSHEAGCAACASKEFKETLRSISINTPLGPMVAGRSGVSDVESLGWEAWEDSCLHYGVLQPNSSSVSERERGRPTCHTPCQSYWAPHQNTNSLWAQQTIQSMMDIGLPILRCSPQQILAHSMT
jgi:hypothetical protein